MLEWTGERYLPELSSPEISYEHWHRYLYATQFVKHKLVLDIACGEGYGTYLLSRFARKVIGVDISYEAIHHAASKYVTENVEFKLGSADSIPIDGEAVFDVIVSFETLEHMSRQKQDSFLRQVKRLLKPNGFLLVSTPNKFSYNDLAEHKNEFHVSEFYIDELKEFLSNHFSNIKLLGQKIYPISYIWTPGIQESKVLEYTIEYSLGKFRPSDAPKSFIYALVICSDAEIDAPPASVLVDLSEMIVRGKNRQILSLEHAIQQKDDYITSLERALSEKEAEITGLRDALNEKETASHQKERETARLQSALKEKEAALLEKEKEVAALQNALNEKVAALQGIYASKTWRFLQKCHALTIRALHLGKKRKSRRSWKQRYLKKIRKAEFRLIYIREKVKLRFLALRFRKLKKSSEELHVQTIEIPHCEPSTNVVACSIVSKNYLAHAITLGRSFRSHNPNSDYYVLLCDLLEQKEDIDLYLRLSSEHIRLIPIYELRNQLDIPDLEEMLFKYNILEMNTSIKPFFLEYLLRSGCGKVVYFDPDVLILNNIDEIEQLLDTHDIVLTPHILEDLPDDAQRPSNIDILKSGIYNLGFIAVKDSEETRRFLRWWQQKLIDGCFVDIENGLHVDQKWVDFVPSLFQKVYVQNRKSYNAAYWNLHEREPRLRDGKWYVGDEPIVFFHFSGILIENLDQISKHQDRFRLKDFPDLHLLFKHYRKELLKNNFFEAKTKSYYFGKLPSTNIGIPDFMRRMYREILSSVSNPWNYDAAESICNFVNEKVYPPITRLWLSIYNARTDLQRAFPSIEKSEENRLRFSHWIRDPIRQDQHLPHIFVNPDLPVHKHSVKRNGVGINLWGYFQLATGMAEAARTLMNAFHRLGIPLLLCDIPSDHHEKVCLDDRQQIKKYLTQNNAHRINLIAANADQLPQIYEHFGEKKFKDKYNIGFWAWELSDYFPFENSFDLVDEVWFFSEFTCQTYKKYTDKPVVRIPFPFRPNWKHIVSPEAVRKQLGIAQNDFVFIFSFDFRSSFERKNPDGVVKAFLKAFKKNESGVKLIVKSQHSRYYPTHYAYLMNLINKSGNKNIIFIDKGASREDYISLVNAADCFVSLHRSEGFGLGIVEALYLRKCVIATNYGGNLEFTNRENSLLVDYELSQIKEDFGPYKAGQLWAEPDIDQSADYMRAVFEDRDLAGIMGSKASRDVRRISAMSTHHIAKRLSEIMETIRE